MFNLLQRSLIYFPTREARIEPQDADLPPGQVHTVAVRADDQLELLGWHVLANGRSAESRDECDRELALGRPLVLYFSGNGANRRYRVPEFGVLTSFGADVFIIDYRGYGDNSGSPSEELFAADARAIWNYATQKRTKPARCATIRLFEACGSALAASTMEKKLFLVLVFDAMARRLAKKNQVLETRRQ